MAILPGAERNVAAAGIVAFFRRQSSAASGIPVTSLSVRGDFGPDWKDRRPSTRLPRRPLVMISRYARDATRISRAEGTGISLAK